MLSSILYYDTFLNNHLDVAQLEEKIYIN